MGKMKMVQEALGVMSVALNGIYLGSIAIDGCY